MWSSAITRLTARCTCGLMSEVVICKHRRVWSYMTLNVLTETRGVIKQHKLFNFLKLFSNSPCLEVFLGHQTVPVELLHYKLYLNNTLHHIIPLVGVGQGIIPYRLI